MRKGPKSADLQENFYSYFPLVKIIENFFKYNIEKSKKSVRK